MIPERWIETWRAQAPWQTIDQVEQDLIISRALADLYHHAYVRDALIFRGGTALNKLFLKPPARYSEDIDFVQKRPEPIGETINAIREALASWLGEPQRKITQRSAKLVYRYHTITQLPAKLKVEINTTEHFQVLPLRTETLAVHSGWHETVADIVTYDINELMATKLRALYQRRKGRDLFDLWYVSQQQLIDVPRMIDIFTHYCAHNKQLVSRKEFLANLELKKYHPFFHSDMKALLPIEHPWHFEEAYDYVVEHIVNRLP